MNWIDLAFRLPLLAALTVGVVVSILKIGSYRLPATLAACGFGIALVQSLFSFTLYSMLRNLTEDGVIGQRIASIVMSSLSAIHVVLLLSAVFSARQIPSSVMDALKQEIAFAASQRRDGVSDDEIETQLAEQGLDPSAVSSVMIQIEKEQNRRAGWRNFVFGGAICTLGFVVTAASYLFAANEPGGGRYMVTYGLIVAGGAQAIRGLVQISK